MRDLRLGLGYGFPLCCIAHFCLDNLLFGKYSWSAVWRGGIERRRKDGSKKVYVPCIVCKHTQPDVQVYPEEQRLRLKDHEWRSKPTFALLKKAWSWNT